MTPPLPQLNPEALKHLRRVDPKLRKVMDQIDLMPTSEITPTSGDLLVADAFQALLRSIIYQQLHARAASAIHQRVLKVLEGTTTAQQVAALLTLPDEPLRAAGLSASKLKALRDLAVKANDGVVPTPEQVMLLGDDDLVAKLTQIHGIGPWTVHMYMMFTLGRPDVLPTGDFAVRKAMSQIYKKGATISLKEMMTLAEPWRPYRTAASWFMWRSLELEPPPPKKVSSKVTPK